MESIELTHSFQTTASEICNAWLSSKGHTAMTGGEAKASSAVGSDYSAWDGYITGKLLAFEPHSRMLFSWRSSEFPEDAEDSQLEVLLSERDSGCQIKLIHSKIPEGQSDRYKKGWVEHYFEPMDLHFS